MSAPPVSHTALTAFFCSLLPPAPSHLPLVYHSPHRPPPAITRVVLSITATPGVYPYLSSPTTALFLHRPWSLDRRKLSRSTLVLASHQRLDELLTTGHNEVLMRRLGVQGEMVPIVGYKNDPERKMGLVGRLPVGYTVQKDKNTDTDADADADADDAAQADPSFDDWLRIIRNEFPHAESHLQGPPSNGDPVTAPTPQYIACMNAFDPEIITRVIASASLLSPSASSPTTSSSIAFHPSQIIYLTGQSRPLALAHAQALGIRVVTTGHREAEAWAIRFLQGAVEREWRGMGIQVVVVDEEEG
ncbi:hypothetical protein QFC19_004719 [Naganishia cerealis]|uniref:Uncharacterized protein n=1 Tax=Naganishia cerealis TaxID=610337 RepID=A0ACC2VT61_9TREE|nr:hypothetical protein QFC19_004719 [Naganishia cerealis]